MESVDKNQIKNEKKNEIIIGIKVENSDINQEIHFMYNIFKKNKEEDSNINKLFLNNKISIFKKKIHI
jgi:hypothetical protein